LVKESVILGKVADNIDEIVKGLRAKLSIDTLKAVLNLSGNKEQKLKISSLKKKKKDTSGKRAIF